jgi:alpha-L-fucosidase
VGEVWVDIPGVLGTKGRKQQYEQIAELAPDAVIMLNSGFGNGSKLKYDYAWPSDIMAIERDLPTSARGYQPWFHIDGKDYYLPGEVCDPIGYEWFYVEGDEPRSDAELLGMRLICHARKVNLLLDVPPDKSGQLPRTTVDALMRLAKNVDRLGYFIPPKSPGPDKS